MDNKKKVLLADLSLLLVALVWGAGFPVSKIALDYLQPMYLLTFRFLIATVILSIVFFKKILTIKMKDIKAGAICGVLLFGGFATQTVGLQYTEASKQAFLTATYVVLVPFLLWLIMKKRPDKYNVIAALLTLVGIYFLTITDGLTVNLNFGDKLTLLCAVFFALQIIAVGFYVKKIDTIKLTIIMFAIASVCSLAFALVSESAPSNLNAEGIGAILFLGVFSTTIAFFTQNIAQNYTSESHAAILMSLEAVFGTLLSILWIGEIFTPLMGVGCFIIFMGIITAETKWKFLRGDKI